MHCLKLHSLLAMAHLAFCVPPPFWVLPVYVPPIPALSPPAHEMGFAGATKKSAWGRVTSWWRCRGHIMISDDVLLEVLTNHMPLLTCRPNPSPRIGAWSHVERRVGRLPAG